MTVKILKELGGGRRNIPTTLLTLFSLVHVREVSLPCPSFCRGAPGIRRATLLALCFLTACKALLLTYLFGSSENKRVLISGYCIATTCTSITD